MFKKILLLLFVFSILSCSKKEVAFNTLVERNGLFYEINNEEEYTGSVFDLFENGQKKFSGEFEDGLKNSEWKEFSENGQILTLTNFKKGKLDGLSITYFENGKIKSEIEYSNDIKDGSAKGYFLSGQIQEESNYKLGKLDGVNKKWHENGTLFREGEYKNGLENGLFKNYYFNGNIETERHYADGKLNGIYKEFFENGKPRLIINYKNDLKNGKMEEWYGNSNKFREIIYLDDMPGDKKTWNEDGTIRPVIEDSIIGDWLCDSSTTEKQFLYYYTINSENTYVENYFNGGYTNYGTPNAKRAYWTTEGSWYVEDDRKLILQYTERCGFGYCDKKHELTIENFDGKVLKLSYENGTKRIWNRTTQKVN